MFTEYFSKQSESLQQALKESLARRGVQAPDREKDVKVFQDFYTFLKEHLPEEYCLATGKVRNKKHLLNRNCDLLIYNKWCARYLDLTGGYILADSMYAFMSIESSLNKSLLQTHANLTRAIKSLYASEKGLGDGDLIPVYSLLFAYGAEAGLDQLAGELEEISSAREIPRNQEMDLVVVLGSGLVIKDYEHGGGYKCIETGPDTLMWFYILFMEYLDREGKLRLDLRDYIKNTSNYGES